MRWLLPLVVLFFLGAPSAFAARDARWLLQTCTQAVAHDDGAKLNEEQSIESLSCVSYVGGFLDAFAISHGVADLAGYKHLFCGPSDLATQGTMQTVRIVVKYMRNHPEELDQGAGVVVMSALQDAFPCRGK